MVEKLSIVLVILMVYPSLAPLDLFVSDLSSMISQCIVIRKSYSKNE